jgi:hypothetical protein
MRWPWCSSCGSQRGSNVWLVRRVSIARQDRSFRVAMALRRRQRGGNGISDGPARPRRSLVRERQRGVSKAAARARARQNNKRTPTCLLSRPGPTATRSSSSVEPQAGGRKLPRWGSRARVSARSGRRVCRTVRCRWRTEISVQRRPYSNPTCRSDRPCNSRRSRGRSESRRCGLRWEPSVRACASNCASCWTSYGW